MVHVSNHIISRERLILNLMINFISKNATAASQLEKKVNSNGYFNGQNINYN